MEAAKPRQIFLYYDEDNDGLCSVFQIYLCLQAMIQEQSFDTVINHLRKLDLRVFQQRCCNPTDNEQTNNKKSKAVELQYCTDYPNQQIQVQTGSRSDQAFEEFFAHLTTSSDSSNSVLIMMDISFDLIKFERLQAILAKIIIIEHHQTFQELFLQKYQLSPIANSKCVSWIFNQTQCSATIAYDFCVAHLNLKMYFGSIEPYWRGILKYIEDHDLFNKKYYPETEYRHQGFTLMIENKHDIQVKKDLFAIILQMLRRENFLYYLKKGRVVYERHQKYASLIQKQKFKIQLRQFTNQPLVCYAVVNNSTVSRNIIGHELIEELVRDKKADASGQQHSLFPMSFVISQSAQQPEMLKVSVRSLLQPELPDVLASSLAQKYGGGGQKTAACFHIQKSDFEQEFLSASEQNNLQLFKESYELGLRALEVQEEELEQEGARAALTNKHKYQQYLELQKKWQIIESPAEPQEKTVGQIMIKLGDDVCEQHFERAVARTPAEGQEQSDNELLIGNSLYLELVRKNLPFFKHSSAKAVNEQDYYQEFAMKKTQNSFKTQIISSKSITKDQFEEKKKVNLLELRIVQAIRQAYQKDGSITGERNGYQLIVFLKKTIQNYKDFTGANLIMNGQSKKENKNYPIASALIEDLQALLHKLVKEFKFNNWTLLQNYPDLIVATEFDKYLTKLQVKANDSQIQVVQQVSNAIKQQELGQREAQIIFNMAVNGDGKTSSAIAIARFIQSFNSQIGGLRGGIGKKYKLIFSNPSTSVQYYLARLAHQQKLPYNFFFRLELTSDKIQFQSPSGFKKVPFQDVPLLIGHDLIAVRKMLAETGNTHYVLFVDEPTIDSDQQKSPILEQIALSLQVAPRIVIFASATFPSVQQIPRFISIYTRRFAPGSVDLESKIINKEFKTGIEIRAFDGQVFSPHMQCRCVADVENVLFRLSENPFLYRIYSATVVNSLYDQIKLHTQFALQNELLQIECIQQRDIQNFAIVLLEKLRTLNDALIIAICYQAIAEQDEQAIINRILTNPDQFQGGCLIACSEPEIHGVSQFLRYANLDNEEFFEKIQVCLEDYMNDLQVYIDKLEQIRQRLEREIEDDDKRLSELNSETERLEKPKITKYAEIKAILQKKLGSQRPLTDTDYTEILEFIQKSRNEDDTRIILLMLIGVGVYSQYMPRDWNAFMIKLNLNGRIGFLISDASISYGTNARINHVVILDDLAQQRSMNTLIQLMSRTSRVGITWKGHIWGGSVTIQKLLQLVMQNQTSEEALKFEQVAEKIFE